MLHRVKVRKTQDYLALVREIKCREQKWLDNIFKGCYTCYWHIVGDVQWSTAVIIDNIRIALTYKSAKKAAEIMGARLPTQEQADAMFMVADHVDPWSTDPVSAETDAIIALTNKLGFFGDRLIDNEGKLWLRGAIKGGSINYGLVDDSAPLRANGLRLWQDVGRTHAESHVDGTQVLRVVRDNSLIAYQGDTKKRISNWQFYLKNLSLRYDHKLNPGSIDGIYGPLTKKATMFYLSYKWINKSFNHLADCGQHLPASFVQAKSYHPIRRDPLTLAIIEPDLIVLHTAEMKEVLTAAESLGQYGLNAKVSWNYAVDPDSIVQSVRENHTPFAAPGANHNGIHIEMPGYAAQTMEQWEDSFSISTIHMVARLVADIMNRRPEFKPKWIYANSLLKGERWGITDHWEVTKAFKKSTHVDVGESFDRIGFVNLVSHYLGVI